MPLIYEPLAKRLHIKSFIKVLMDKKTANDMRLILILTAICLTVIFTTINDYGIAWDESVQLKYGDLVLSYFTSGFTDKSSLSFNDLMFYGPIFELFSSIIVKTTGFDKYLVHHFCTALAAIFTMVGVIKISLLFRNKFLTFFSPLSLFMFPVFYGHSFVNSKDIPFACFFTWAMYAIIRLTTNNNFPWIKIIIAGVTIGLALAVRVGGLLLFFLMALIILFACITKTINLYFSCKEKKACANDGIRLNFITFLKLFTIIPISWTIMIAFWPWAHENIIVRPIEAFQTTTAFHLNYPVLFEGKTYLSDNLPWYYLPKYFFITTPVPLLFFMASGFLFAIKTIITSFKKRDSFLYIVLLIWALVPIFYCVILRPNIYDGIRHFLFIVPAFSIFCGAGATFLIEKFGQLWNEKLILSFAAIFLLSPIIDIVALHPYEITYFNLFAGIIDKQERKYEGDYWLLSYKEAIEWIKEREKNREGNINILVTANELSKTCAEHFASSNMKISASVEETDILKLPAEFDYYVSTTRFFLHENYPKSPIVHEIGKGKTLFTIIRKRL